MNDPCDVTQSQAISQMNGRRDLSGRETFEMTQSAYVRPTRQNLHYKPSPALVILKRSCDEGSL